MLTVSAPTHSSNSNFLRRKNENKATTSQEKATESLGWRSRWKDRPWRTEPQEKVCQTSEDREADE